MKLPRFPIHTFGRWYSRMVCREEYAKQKKTKVNERAVELGFVFGHLAKTCPKNVLDVGSGSTDREIKGAVAGYLDVTEARFRSYVVERHENGNITVRPEAVFG